MKVIDLLNKIANGEEVPKKIKFYGKYYIWYDNRYTGNEGYCLEPLKSDSNSFLEINTVYDLNNEIEILEEEDKDIPLIPDDELYVFKGDSRELNYNFRVLKEKINQILEVMNNEYNK